MGNLRLNIKNIRANISNTLSRLDDFSNSVLNMTTTYKKMDTCWNDNTSVSFIKTVAKDEESFSELVKSINNQIRTTEMFCDEIERCVMNYFGVDYLSDIKYIESSVERGITTLSEIQTRIGNVKNSVAALSIPSSSSTRSDIRSLLSDVSTGEINNVREKINSVIKAINSSISTAKYNASRIPKFEMDSSTIKFISSIETPNLSRIGSYREKAASATKETVKAKLDGVTNTDVDDNISYINAVQKADLGDAEKQKTQSEISYAGSAVKADLGDEKQKNVDNNLSYEEATVKADLEGLEDNKPKEDLSYAGDSVKADLEGLEDTKPKEDLTYAGDSVKADLEGLEDTKPKEDLTYAGDSVKAELDSLNANNTNDTDLYSEATVKGNTEDIGADIEQDNKISIYDNSENNIDDINIYDYKEGL